MKNWIFAFVAGALIAGATPLVAEDVFRLEIGTKGSSNRRYPERDMKFRVSQLELAVDQLQRKVFDLEMSPRPRPLPTPAPSPTWTTCFIKTPFDGTFTSTEPTETAAKARTLEKCTAKANSIYCMERDVKCGQ